MRAHRCLSDGRRSCSCGRGVRRRLLCARDPTHATRGAACVVPHLHGLWGRRLGREALVLSCITTPPTTHDRGSRLRLAALMRAGCVWGRLLCARVPTHTPHAMRHVSCRICMATGGAGWAARRSVGHHHSPYARPRPRLVALMLMRAGRGCGGGSCALETQRTRHTRCGMCRAVFAWPLGAPAGPRGARSVVHHHHPTHDHGPGWRRSCAQGSAGAAPVHLRPNAHATRGEGCVVLYSHGLWGRRLGHGGIVGLEPPQASSTGP